MRYFKTSNGTLIHDGAPDGHPFPDDWTLITEAEYQAAVQDQYEAAIASHVAEIEGVFTPEQAAAILRLHGITGTGGGAPPAPDVERVNVNTATEDELDAVPGISKGLAKRIIKEREDEGPFTSIDDMDDRVSGISPSTRSEINSWVTV